MSRTRVKSLAHDTLEANKRFFGNDIRKVPTQALTVGVGTVMAAKEVRRHNQPNNLRNQSRRKPNFLHPSITI